MNDKCFKLFCLAWLIHISACNYSSKNILPSFSAQTISGKNINSDSLKGKIIVIDIWATWCGNCINELNSLNAVVEKYKLDSNVVFIAITDEPNEKVNRFLEHRDFNFQHIANAATLKNLLHKGLIQEIPKTIIINKNGELILDLIGEKPNIENILSTIIDKELKQAQH
jgi:thiol-disulfide isomerase/thioredoxin